MIGVRQLLKFQSPSAEFSLTSAFRESNVLAGSRFRLAVSTSVPGGDSEQLPEMSGGLRMHGPGGTPPAVIVLAEGPTDARRESVLDVANSAFRQTLPTRIFDCGLTGNRPYVNRPEDVAVARRNCLASGRAAAGSVTPHRHQADDAVPARLTFQWAFRPYSPQRVFRSSPRVG